MIARRTNGTPSELFHHGVKGMHWGVRRYQNKDGSLTAAGRKRYSADLKKDLNETNILDKKSIDKTIKKRDDLKQIHNDISNDEDFKKVTADKKHLEDTIDKYGKEFEKDVVKYVKQSVIAKGCDPKENMDEFNREMSFCLDDDGDQGETGSAWDFFLKSKGTSYSEMQQKADDIYKKQEKIIKNYTDDVLKDIGDEPISEKAYSTTAKSFVTSMMEEKFDTYTKVYKFPNTSGYTYEWAEGSGKEGKFITYAESRSLHSGLDGLSYEEYNKKLAERLYGKKKNKALSNVAFISSQQAAQQAFDMHTQAHNQAAQQAVAIAVNNAMNNTMHMNMF